MNRPASHLALILGVTLFSFTGAWAQHEAVINDPDGYTNVRSQPSMSAPVIAKVEHEEIFTYETTGALKNSKWVKVTLASGKRGWMHTSRVLDAELKDFAYGRPTDEMVSYGKSKGFDYYALGRAAVRGEHKAMAKFFSLDDLDGGAAEVHAGTLYTAVLLIGDDKLCAFLKTRTAAYREKFYKELLDGSFDSKEHLHLALPESVKLVMPE
jgi:hypothetical protein